MIGLRDNAIRQEALKKSWDLKKLRHERMKMESAARGSSEIAGGNNVYKVGKYSMKYSMKQKTGRNNSKHIDNQKITCYNCGNTVEGSVVKLVKEKFPATSTKCYKCEKTGHFARQCKNSENVRELKTENVADDEQVKQAEVIINNSLDIVIVDTGAKVSVCGINHAKK